MEHKLLLMEEFFLDTSFSSHDFCGACGRCMWGVYLSVSVYAHVHAGAGVHVCACVWRLEVHVKCLFQFALPLIFETGSLSEPGAH